MLTRTRRTNLEEVPFSMIYNGLPDLKTASQFVRTNGLVGRMCAVVSDIFNRHGVQHHWGIDLLHRHHELGDGEVMGETLRPGDGMYECVMQPISVDASGHVPVTYRVHEGGFRPLEFSCAAYAKAANEMLAAKPAFLAELATALVDNGLEDHFGLGVVRPVLNRMDFRWVETSDHNTRTSVLRHVPYAQMGEHVVKASWSFAGEPCRNCVNN